MITQTEVNIAGDTLLQVFAAYKAGLVSKSLVESAQAVLAEYEEQLSAEVAKQSAMEREARVTALQPITEKARREYALEGRILRRQENAGYYD